MKKFQNHLERIEYLREASEQIDKGQYFKKMLLKKKCKHDDCPHCHGTRQNIKGLPCKHDKIICNCNKCKKKT